MKKELWKFRNAGAAGAAECDVKTDGRQNAAARFPAPTLVPQTGETAEDSPTLERVPQQGEFVFPACGSAGGQSVGAGPHGQRVPVLPAAGVPGVGSG